MTRAEYSHLSNLEHVHPRGVLGPPDAPQGWPNLGNLLGYEALGWVERFRPGGGDVLWRLSAAGAAALREERESGRPLER